jgi:glutamate synthase (NADPH/NADH) large chain
LLATSATHQSLVRAGLRTSTGLVVDTGSAREVHHFALLGGYGAEAVCPWLAFQSIAEMVGGDTYEANKNFIKAISKGLHKVMSKMGISTYQSYCGAQIFEAIGLNTPFIEKYFTGTATHIEGIGLDEVSTESFNLHTAAFGNDPVLANAQMQAVNMLTVFAVKSTCGPQIRLQNYNMQPVLAKQVHTKSMQN